jgi:uncharacterized Rmd1/YagE family protein
MESELNRFRCNWQIRRNGKKFKANDLIELSDEQASGLISSGAISVAIDDVSQQSDKPDTHDELMSNVIDAITGLPSDVELFTEDGRPKVSALEMALNYDITAEERDAAWEQIVLQKSTDN